MSTQTKITVSRSANKSSDENQVVVKPKLIVESKSKSDTSSKVPKLKIKSNPKPVISTSTQSLLSVPKIVLKQKGIEEKVLKPTTFIKVPLMPKSAEFISNVPVLNSDTRMLNVPMINGSIMPIFVPKLNTKKTTNLFTSISLDNSGSMGSTINGITFKDYCKAHIIGLYETLREAKAKTLSFSQFTHQFELFGDVNSDRLIEILNTDTNGGTKMCLPIEQFRRDHNAQKQFGFKKENRFVSIVITDGQDDYSSFSHQIIELIKELDIATEYNLVILHIGDKYHLDQFKLGVETILEKQSSTIKIKKLKLTFKSLNLDSKDSILEEITKVINA